ncbi:signal peptidase I [Coxiella endosymbiont of Ornithodoros maritimus]|uniref:signal peptidase I n=1 Tax=Coxiella endosymbiont of Ornithodoros maritimus TaxID=1656172 RepID=UPI002264FD17|nr:signal peptidase I [Coxiella endosymbiont of Ornithodoros maritimus]
MIVDFAFYLTVAVILTGVISFIDKLFLKKRRSPKAKASLSIEYAKIFFPVLLIVWVVRSFIIQPYHVPTGSLEPTVIPGDFIAVEQFAYGLRLPVFNKKILPISEPKRGEIALFRWPKDPKIVFIKRVIGLPGDHIVYKHKQLYINGQEQKQNFLYKTNDVSSWGYRHIVNVKEENLDGVKHKIYVHPAGGETEDYNLIVPPRYYFMMGDNRDNSDDSRQWGFVPERDLIGKAFGIWMSWDKLLNQVRWDRIGNTL